LMNWSAMNWRKWRICSVTSCMFLL
jgi:hypothetical protein